MAIYNENIIDIDLESGQIHRSFAHKAIGEGDKNGNRYGIRAYRNGTPVDLTGCMVTGYFIRADQTTIIIEGVASENKAYVELNQNCYVTEGNFALAIKVTGGGITGTMRIVDGTVVNTVAGTVVDPGGTVPDLSELMAVIERAEAAAETVAGFVVTEELIEGDDYRLIVDDAEE